MVKRYYVSRHEISWVPLVLDKIGGFEKVDAAYDGPDVEFGWVHTVGEHDGPYHAAKIRGGNAVHGTQVLEDKFKLALLCQDGDLTGLESFALEGAQAVAAWCTKKFQDAQDGRLWMIKDSAANCGDGLFVTGKENWQQVVEKVGELERNSRKKPMHFVAQSYIMNPDLWESKFKYHIRVYVVLRADMSSYIHRRALIHVANKPFSTMADGFVDEQIHLTNVSKNHKNTELFHGCPVISLEDYLGLERHSKLLERFRGVFQRAQAYMKNQLSGSDFSHIGADIMFDADGVPHLLECNIPPCIGNYNSEMVPEQHEFFDRLFTSMVSKFVFESPESEDEWIQISPPRDGFVPCEPTSIGLNKLSWAIAEKKALKKVVS